MYAIDRLMFAGVKPEKAFDIMYFFLLHDNENGLERYACELEHGQRQRSND